MIQVKIKQFFLGKEWHFLLLITIFLSCGDSHKQTNLNSETINELRTKSTKAYFGNDFEKSFLFLDSAISLGAHSVDVFNEMGLVCRDLGKYKKSIESFKSGLLLSKTRKDSWMLLSNLTVTYNENKEYEKGLVSSKKLLSYSNSNTDSLGVVFFQVDALQGMKKFDEALTLLIKTENKTFFLDTALNDYLKNYYYVKRGEIYLKGKQDTLRYCESLRKALNFGPIEPFNISFCE